MRVASRPAAARTSPIGPHTPQWGDGTFAQFAEARGSKPGSQDPLAGAPAFNFLTGEPMQQT